MAEAVRSLLRNLVEPSGIETHLDDRLSDEPSTEALVVVYFIVREALINVRQHAHARNVVIAIETNNEGILVTVEDNGAGFDTKTDPQLPGDLGLEVMLERAERAGGWLRADSAIGFGTTIAFWIPSGTQIAQPE